MSLIRRTDELLGWYRLARDESLSAGTSRRNQGQRPEDAQMARIVLFPGIEDDFEKTFIFLFEQAPDPAAERIGEIIAAIDILEFSLLHRAAHRQRETRTGHLVGASGYIALY